MTYVTSNTSPKKSRQIPLYTLFDAFAANLQKSSRPISTGLSGDAFVVLTTICVGFVVLVMLYFSDAGIQKKGVVVLLLGFMCFVGGYAFREIKRHPMKKGKQEKLLMTGAMGLWIGLFNLFAARSCDGELSYWVGGVAAVVTGVGGILIAAVVYKELWGGIRSLRSLKANTIAVEKGRDGFEICVNDEGQVFRTLMASVPDGTSEDEMRARLEKLFEGQCIGVRQDGVLEILCRQADLATAMGVMESVLRALKRAGAWV